MNPAMHEKIQLARSRHQLARLLALSQEQKKALEENPRPFLDKAYAEVARHRKMLDDIRAAANGIDSSVSPSELVTYESPESGLMRRLQRIRKVLDQDL